MENQNKGANEQIPGTDSLNRIAIFIEGIKIGKGGNILPLGNNDLEQLWEAIVFLQRLKRDIN